MPPSLHEKHNGPPYDFYPKMTYIYTSRKGVDHNAKFFGASRYGKAGYNAKLENC